ncbi:MAG: BlaI/MecI/CopY family transcriptional regulator [Streptomyces sp.]|uniref:BlaI/MecI/CopY family transcriptional regulator n=1 Tax=Streptomyces sp. TaxID=1931 RepID=UPI0025E5E169|nr:BlaI/MecI/CopY family transcriptional regulator [Streptomyces sp.]MBW8796568.1 BlaI/MecI/CopY family transcriptional regulator [Streptomyces sp.]
MTSRPASSLRSRYVEQAASDLEENRRRQRELTEKIAVLQQEEALLTDILSLAERYEGLPDASRPPATLQSESVPGQGRHVSGRQGRGTTRPGAEEKPRHPLLGDVLLDLLRGHDEPRLAKEIRDELLEKHPDRTPTPQVVRNTLESLVAKGRVRRTRQRRSVLYTPREPEEHVPAETGAVAG